MNDVRNGMQNMSKNCFCQMRWTLKWDEHTNDIKTDETREKERNRDDRIVYTNECISCRQLTEQHTPVIPHIVVHIQNRIRFQMKVGRMTVSDENRRIKYVDFVARLRTTEFRDLSENKNSISSPCFRSSSVSAFNYYYLCLFFL